MVMPESRMRPRSKPVSSSRWSGIESIPGVGFAENHVTSTLTVENPTCFFKCSACLATAHDWQLRHG
jgi:hypothetical protein